MMRTHCRGMHTGKTLDGMAAMERTVGAAPGPAGTAMRPLSFPSLVLAMALPGLLSGCTGTAPKHFTQAQSPDHFTPCSSAPHCVSSQAAPGSSHYVAPFTYTGSTRQAREVLLQTLRASDHATVALAEPRFIHATFRSAVLGFVDDVTFILQPQQDIIDVKSSARLGYYDFGVNRRRVEQLRTRFDSLLKSP